jgi:hypothetical protein
MSCKRASLQDHPEVPTHDCHECVSARPDPNTSYFYAFTLNGRAIAAGQVRNPARCRDPFGRGFYDNGPGSRCIRFPLPSPRLSPFQYVYADPGYVRPSRARGFQVIFQTLTRSAVRATLARGNQCVRDEEWRFAEHACKQYVLISSKTFAPPPKNADPPLHVRSLRVSDLTRRELDPAHYVITLRVVNTASARLVRFRIVEPPAPAW